MTTKQSFKNALACITSSIIGAIVFLRIGRRFLPFIPFVILIGIAVIYLLSAVIYIFIWNRKAKRPDFNSSSRLAFWQGITRYFIALDLCTIGFQKIFHLQFMIPLGVLNNPFSSLTGEQMVWAFFGHFYAFTVIIAALQIGGSLLLLFSRTRLFGTIILLPVLFNIMLLDYFYNLGTVVNIYVSLLTLAVIYLLLLDYDRLVQFFFAAKNNLPAVRFKHKWIKYVLRLSVIGIPLLLMAIYRFPQYYPEIYGKYKVSSFTVNNTAYDTTTGKDSVLTKVFIDKTDFVMEYNNYQRRFIGDYQYDEKNKKLTVIWHYPTAENDTLAVQVVDGKLANSKVLLGRMGKQQVRVEMLKVE